MKAPGRSVLLLPVLLAACAQPVAAPVAAQGPVPVVYQVDRTGAAAHCTVTPQPPEGAGGTVAMQVGNDGGWCAVLAAQTGHVPYAAGLLTTRPAHGTLTIHSVGYETRLDYVPAPGYAGPDSFAATLLPGRRVIQAGVTVTR